MLSFPATRGKKKELQTFDDKLKKKYPNIYDENINKAIAILRKSRYFCIIQLVLLSEENFLESIQG